MNQDQTMSLIRTFLKVIGGALMAHGATNAASWVNAEDTAGLILAISGFVSSHLTHSTGVEAGPPPSSNGTGTATKAGLILLGAGLLWGGCAALDPGANALIVRTEQAEATGYSTLDTFLKIDDADRGFFITNAPAMHQFAESLRQWKVIIMPDGTVQTNRVWVSYLKSLDAVKVSYKAGTTSSNALAIALATVETAIGQAQQYIVQNPGK